MKSFRISLRNVVAIAICLAAFANQALAQTFNYTDASGVNCTYEPTTFESVDVVHLTAINSMPSNITKWVLPVTITQGATTYRVVKIGAYGVWDRYNLKSASLQEIVLPKYMYHCGGEMSTTTFPSLHKITFGEDMTTFPDTYVPFDTIVFMGTGVIHWDGSLYNDFKDCPSTTKIIIPCGTMQQFTTAFENQGTRWNEYNGWTTANFEEAPCLNTLTVLSSDVSLGNAYSFAGCGFVTQTPDNTSATYSGTITLLAVPQGGKVFVGWNDGVLENPRVVTVSSDVTFTANFAACSDFSGIVETLHATSLRVYPNPANSTLNVELGKQVNNGMLTLFDISGKTVLSQAVNGSSAQINLSALTAGNYILRLVENGAASAGIQVIKN